MTLGIDEAGSGCLAGSLRSHLTLGRIRIR